MKGKGRGLLDFEPSYCPNCGRRINLSDRATRIRIYRDKDPYGCTCGIKIQLVDPSQVIFIPQKGHLDFEVTPEKTAQVSEVTDCQVVMEIAAQPAPCES